MLRDLAGGEPLPIFEGFASHVRWSADGTELLIKAEDGLYLLPRLGGTPRQVKGGPCCISWSPDGKYYTSSGVGAEDIWIRERSTSQGYSISLKAASFVWLGDVDWSHRNDLLAFVTTDEEDRYAVWTIPPKGGTPVKVVEESSPIGAARWSGTAAAIYYLRAGESTSELWKVHIDSRTGRADLRPAPVLTGLQAGRGVQNLDIARDDQTLVYTKETAASHLWRVTRGNEGSSQPVETQRLTSGTSMDGSPSVSPDGRQLAFTRRGAIYVMPLEGGPARQLTFLESEAFGPAWSPDGTWVAFVSNEGGSPRVWRIPAKGGTPRPFGDSRPSGDYRGEVRWAPGDRILYQRPGNRNYHFLDPDTEEETPLAKDDSVGWVFNPILSPDGTHVVVFWNRFAPSGEREQGLWMISLEDSAATRISPRDQFFPLAWSEDGKWISAWNGLAKAAVKLPAGGGEFETVFEWPFGEDTEGDCRPAPGLSDWVCWVAEHLVDVWLVENFDPEVN
jgi:Tol biopolymer transport system component